MAIGANILAIIFGLAGFRLSISRGWAVFAFYTQISNLVALLSSVAFLIFGAPASWFRYLGVCMLAMTLVVTLFILVPMGGGFEELMLSGVGLYHHTLCPLMALASFIKVMRRSYLAANSSSTLTLIMPGWRNVRMPLW